MRDQSVVFFHTIAPNRTDVDLAKKFTSLRAGNINATLVILKSKESSEDFPINIYANEFWLGNPSVVFSSDAEGGIFLAGFPSDIGSDGLFDSAKISDNKPKQMFEIGSKTKIIAVKSNGKLNYWGDATLESFVTKIKEIGRFIRSDDPIYSTTQYRLLGSNKDSKIQSNKHRISSGVDQLHNESHLQTSLAHIEAVSITKNDYEKKEPEWKSLSGNDILFNSGIVTKLLALKTKKHITDARRKALLATDEDGKKELEFCVDVELSKSLVALQKLAMCYEQIKFNNENKDLSSNPRMRYAFILKKRKEPRFDEESLINQKKWIKSQNEYFESQIINIQKEIAELEETYDFKINLAGRDKMPEIISLTKFSEEMTKIAMDRNKDYWDLSGLFKKKLDFWQIKIKENFQIRELIKDKVKKKLEKEIAITIYDKDKQTSEVIDESDLKIYIEELKKSPLLIYQLVKSNLSEELDQIYPDIEEKEKAIMKDLDESLKKENAKNLLEMAIDKNQDGIIDIILKNDSRYKNECLLYAVKMKKIELVKKFLDKGISVDPENSSLKSAHYSALMIASKNGDLEIVKLLLERGANTNIYNENSKDLSNSALMYASENGHLDIVKMLLSKGADPKHNFKEKTSISLAKSCGKHDVARCIENYQGITPSQHALHPLFRQTGGQNQCTLS